MKNKVIILVLIVMMLILNIYSLMPQKNILKTIDIDNKCNIKKEINTHSGFNGDGDYFAKIKCNKINYKELSSNWKKLPLTSNISEVMKMEQCNGNDCKNVYKKYSIPNVKNGYYYFLDRHSKSKNKYDDSNLNKRSSINFSLAILDTDTNIIYYYELDT